MPIIKPADNSPQFKGKGSGIGEVREHGHAVQGSNDKNGSASFFPSQDYLDLSEDLQKLLTEIESEVHELVRENPRFQRLVLNKPAGKEDPTLKLAATTFLSKAKTFLADEQYQKLSDDDPHFAEFYAKVDRLAKVTNQALAQTQQLLRNNPTPHTYGKPA